MSEDRCYKRGEGIHMKTAKHQQGEYFGDLIKVKIIRGQKDGRHNGVVKIEALRDRWPVKGLFIPSYLDKTIRPYMLSARLKLRVEDLAKVHAHLPTIPELRTMYNMLSTDTLDVEYYVKKNGEPILRDDGTFKTIIQNPEGADEIVNRTLERVIKDYELGMQFEKKKTTNPGKAQVPKAFYAILGKAYEQCDLEYRWADGDIALNMPRF